MIVYIQWIFMNRYISIIKIPFKRQCDTTLFPNCLTHSKMGATTDQWISKVVRLTIWNSLMTRSFFFKNKMKQRVFTTISFIFKLKDSFYNGRWFPVQKIYSFHNMVISFQYKKQRSFSKLTLISSFKNIYLLTHKNSDTSKIMYLWSWSVVPHSGYTIDGNFLFSLSTK